jgi:hypothetical protein
MPSLTVRRRIASVEGASHLKFSTKDCRRELKRTQSGGPREKPSVGSRPNNTRILGEGRVDYRRC